MGNSFETFLSVVVTALMAPSLCCLFHCVREWEGSVGYPVQKVKTIKAEASAVARWESSAKQSSLLFAITDITSCLALLDSLSFKSERRNGHAETEWSSCYGNHKHT